MALSNWGKSRRYCFLVAVLLAFTQFVHADIYQWQWVDPNNHSLGKIQSATLTPGGAGVSAVPNSYLYGLDLTQGYLIGADLNHSDFRFANLTNADLSNSNLSFGAFFTYYQGSTNTNLSGANLINADLSNSDLRYVYLDSSTLTNANLSGANLSATYFGNATLTNANLNGATISGAGFSGAIGLTSQQIYSTISYQNHDLQNIGLENHNLAGWDLSNQNLSGANLGYATLASANLSNANLSSAFLYSADLTNADVKGANFFRANFYLADAFTPQQLYSTASYVNHDLQGAGLSSNDLSGWDFQSQNLASANFSNATLSGSNFTGATVTFANFGSTAIGGFTGQQLYSTASYINHDLRGVNVTGLNLAGGDFSNQNLASANFNSATLSAANFTGATITAIGLGSTTGRGFTAQQLYSTLNYQAHDLHGIGLSSNNLNGWDFSNQNLTAANFRGATLTFANFSGATINGANFARLRPGFTTIPSDAAALTAAQLYSTASYQNRDLGGVGLAILNLSGWDFSNQNLTSVNFFNSTLTFANFSGATIGSANFSGSYSFSGGLSAAQLYSTASYKARDLRGVQLSNLFDVDLSNQNLSNARLEWNMKNASFANANLSGALLSGSDLNGADFRGATLPPSYDNYFFYYYGAIAPDGNLDILNPIGSYPYYDSSFVVRDHDSIPIHILASMSVVYSTLDVRLRDGTWGSTISFEPGASVYLGGTLQVKLEPSAVIPELVGKTFQLFQWNSPPTSSFDQIATDDRFLWDISDLYSDGTIELVHLFGDANDDGYVGIDDLFKLAQDWQLGTHPGDPVPGWADADFNSDGVVNLADLQILSRNWGVGGTTPAVNLSPLLASLGLPDVTVPEPGGLATMLGLFVGSLRLRRRGMGAP